MITTTKEVYHTRTWQHNTHIHLIDTCGPVDNKDDASEVTMVVLVLRGTFTSLSKSLEIKIFLD